jgi:LuxR family maltose regulon positive regulatory protein
VLFAKTPIALRNRNCYNLVSMKTIQLLQTKVSIPSVRVELVPRPRLIEYLNQGLDRKLTLVSAPAGFGKTTLLASWAKESGSAVAWLSVDESENDPARFMAYLGASLGEIESEIGAQILNRLDSPRFAEPESSLSEEDLLTGLINRLSSLSQPILLILDDYHLISAHSIHRWVEFLIEHQPAHMHMVIASRADPPLPLARWRGRGQLNELRLADLRFTTEEAADFLKDSMGLEIDPRDLEALAHKTEGWIAGLQMAALAMQSPAVQSHGGVSHFIQAFTGSSRFILDYLLEEVLQRQPASIQNFLLKSSILDRLSGPLCNYVLERERAAATAESLPSGDSRDILEHLDHANLFIVPLDDRREWYRYHRLFSDLLRKRLRHLNPALPPALHRRASDWYESNGFTYQAIEHALEGEALERAANLIQETAERVLRRGELATLKNWISRLPPKLVQTRPDMDLYWVTGLVFSGAPIEVVQSNLERLESQHENMAAEVMVLRAYIALYQMRLILAEDLAEKALTAFDGAEGILRSTAEWILSVCQLGVEDLSQRLVVLEKLVRISQALDNHMFIVTSRCQLAEVLMKMGKVVESRDLYLQTFEEAIRRDGRPLPIAGQAMMGLGQVQSQWNELEEAERCYRESIELIQQWHQFGAIEGYMGLADCLQARGAWGEAEEALLQAHALAVAYDSTDIDDRVVEMYTARFRLNQGNSEEVWRYFDRHKMEEPSLGAGQADSSLQQALYSIEAGLGKYEDILRARAHLAENRPDQALAVLDPWLPLLEKQHRAMLLIEVEILRALALQALQREDESQAAFERALALAEPGRFVRLFTDEGESIASFLCQAIQREVCPNYADRLLAALPGELPAKAELITARSSEGLIEPLSERELEVLHYLRSPLTVPEIARELYIAESTVRSHVKNIYGKLEVHSRMEAVQRAEELDIFR